MFAALYQQSAAEYRALCYQAYNIARERIENYKPVSSKPLALITDIDETILDNSPFAVHQALQNKEYVLADWHQWTARGNADTMPGAAAFLKFAADKGLQIFYITNRDSVERTGTLQNLRKFNLPYAEETHLLTRSGSSSKEARRQQVMKDFEIVVLMGDNLADLSSIFDKKTMSERNANVDQLGSEFGKKFIVFPNTGYGDWESSFLNYKYDYTPAQKDSMLRAGLKSY